MAEEESSLPVIAVTAAVGAVVLLLALLCGLGRSDKKRENEDEKQESEGKTEKSTGDKPVKKSKLVQKSKKTVFVPFSHQWLACSLKGHSNRVVSLDFSPNGKYLVSASDDRVLMLWSTKEFSQKEHKFIRMNVELDSVTNIKFSPDSRAVVGSLANSNTVRVFRVGKKDDGSGNVGVLSTADFPKAAPAEIRNIGVSSKGNFIMAGLAGTQIIIYDLKGEQQEMINTHQMSNNYSAVSPCGRFVACSGFTPDVKIWEVSGTAGEIKVIRAMELKGHNSGIYCFSFNGDSSRAATVSKDGTWKLWDTDVRYSQGQDAKLLFTGSVSLEGPNLIALSPDGRTVAISGQSSVVFWDALAGKELQTLHKLHSEPITGLAFDNTNHYLVTSGDKHIQVVHNVPGYQATVVDLQEKEKKATSAGMRDRIRSQIKEASETLATILGESNGSAAGAK
ncbi:transducin beta-like protein 2 [Babylonia areolata]|uniref:transducin beta-like protein 2 n=1 Tax=Babylonia areolata TaxID=304850 RepID=UPI003FD0944D